MTTNGYHTMPKLARSRGKQQIIALLSSPYLFIILVRQIYPGDIEIKIGFDALETWTYFFLKCIG